MALFLELKEATKSYSGAARALDGFSLEVERGELVVVVGPSGCGKSTLLRLVAGLEQLDSGSIFIEGRRIDALPPGKRNLALMLQNYTLFPHLTIFDNMAYGLRLKKMDGGTIRNKIETAAQTLGLSDLLRRYPHSLSGGQRQRAALGRAMVREPSIFLLDEPLSNLDAQLRTQMRGEINVLQKKLDATMIYVTHDQTEAMTLGHRIVVLREGVIQQAGTPDEIYHHPSNQFTAEFIGSPGMNTLRAKWAGEQGSKLILGERTWEVPQFLEEKLTRYTEDEIVVGFRPEHAWIEDVREEPRLEVEVNIVTIENLGSGVWLNGQTAGQKVTVPYTGNLPDAGQLITLFINWEDLYFFHAGSGKVL